jgi:hypothetical protein
MKITWRGAFSIPGITDVAVQFSQFLLFGHLLFPEQLSNFGRPLQPSLFLRKFFPFCTACRAFRKSWFKLQQIR